MEGADIRQLKVIHTWEEEDGSDQEYYGSVIKFKKKKTSKITIYEYTLENLILMSQDMCIWDIYINVYR